jgi:hypothetical protein
VNEYGTWLPPANSDVDPSAGFAELSVGKYFAHQRFLSSTTSSPSTSQYRHHDNNTSHHSSHIIHHNTFGHLGTTRLLIVLGVFGTCWHFQQDLHSLILTFVTHHLTFLSSPYLVPSISTFNYS